MKAAPKFDERIRSDVFDHVDVVVDERTPEHGRVEHHEVEERHQAVAKHGQHLLVGAQTERTHQLKDVVRDQALHRRQHAEEHEHDRAARLLSRHSGNLLQ